MNRLCLIGQNRSTLRTPAAFALALLLSAGPLVTTTSAGPVWESEKSAFTIFDVWVSRGELTVDVRNVPLAQVLRTIGEAAGVDVTLRGDLDTLVTESFAGVAMVEGLRRLARGHSLAVTYAPSAGEPRPRVLTRIWVMGGSSIPEAPEATVHFPLGGWIDGIQALTEEADHGSEAAGALLTDISASEPNAIVRSQAVAALGRLKGAEIEIALTAALTDDDVSVRLRAVRGLRGTGTETAVQSLTGVLIGDADAQVRLAALRALASFPGRPMLQGLATASSDPDAFVRETATRGLSWWTTRFRGAP